MVISRSGDMILACHDNKVRRLSVGGRVVTLINTKPYRPEGMCLTDSDEVVVCLRGREVAVYSPDGRSKLREIRGEDSQGTPQISDPYRVVCNGKDLCVVDGDSNVVCVDESDNVRWIYDDKQVKLMKKFYPLGICVDKYHHLLVTDYNNHCVHYLNREGELIQVILTQEQTGLRWPWGIMCR
ncbi:hypothetical protein FSP39_017443 [Pinctada imbricata]|uniref:Tripartite motif-containing protein 2 n=1 Tax=Pinctada imbricata TaxID=66713 RepID=A0AA89BL07_PINIB|nr:hypothetical protein FSP39_017443 [Pinctada imbricata]